jgi:hypothetical protein
MVVGLTTASFGQTPAAAPQSATGDSVSRVVTALDRLDAWLGNNPNGDRWRRHLRTSELRRELQKGVDADAKVVTAAAERFTANTPGLHMGPFVAVRNALRTWLLELGRQPAIDLPNLALSAGTRHTPITDDQLAAARREMRTRAESLLRRLGRDSRLARNWQRYLKWEQLQPHLAENFQANRRSLTQLDEVLRRLRANQAGLELPMFTDLANAIVKYRALASWTLSNRTRDPRAAYNQVLRSMSVELQRHLERPTTETTWQVGRVLGVLDGLGQATDVVAAVRRRFVKPNIEATISANIIKRMPDRRLNEARPVRDCILGTTIIGTAFTTGEVEYALGSSSNSISLAIHLTGAADSNNNGYNGPVRIRTRGRTNYFASSELFLNDEQFRASPVSAHADTHTRIQSINKTGGQFGARLVEKIAWRRAGEQKGQAERISSQHTEQRVAREFTETVERDLATLRQRYEREVRAPLIRRGIQPEYLHMHSNPTAAAIETILAARNQLGADRDPPRPAQGSDFAVQVHESAVSNYLVLALANARISQEAADIAPALQGDVPNWIKAMSIARPRLAAAAATGAEIIEEAQETIGKVVNGQDDEQDDEEPKAPPFKPYSITLNGEAPVGIRFDDGKLIIRVRASRLVSDDAEYFNWDFIVSYQITTNGDRIVLRRVDDIEVFPTGFDPAWDKQLSAQQSGFRSTLAKNMNARARSGQGFPAEIPIEPIRLTRFGTLLLYELQADDGWLTIAWVLPPTATPQPLVPPRPGATLTR